MNQRFYDMYYGDGYKEVLDFIASIIILGLALSLRYWIVGAYSYALTSFFSIGIGFLLHELAHRYTARKFGAISKYRAWYPGLLLSLVIAIVTRGNIIFAAPGAVEIYMTWYTPRIEAVISLAGPFTNIFLALMCTVINTIFSLSFLQPYINILAYINAVLAFFNLIPIPPLDGFKALKGYLLGWIVLFALSLVLVIYYY
ncbi:MAG: site-2 protease family protein [Ignisphaera sp.]